MCTLHKDNVELHRAEHLSMINAQEDGEYHVAIRTAVIHVGQRTEISNTSARDRRPLLANTLYFLLGELERGCELQKFRTARSAEESLARVRAIMQSGSLYFPVQRNERDTTALVEVGGVLDTSKACCRAKAPIKK